jgi:hypothetical protein
MAPVRPRMIASEIFMVGSRNFNGAQLKLAAINSKAAAKTTSTAPA